LKVFSGCGDRLIQQSSSDVDGRISDGRRIAFQDFRSLVEFGVHLIGDVVGHGIDADDADQHDDA